MQLIYYLFFWLVLTLQVSAIISLTCSKIRAPKFFITQMSLQWPHSHVTRQCDYITCAYIYIYIHGFHSHITPQCHYMYIHGFGITTMKLSKDLELAWHKNNECTQCNNLFYWMLLTALANRRRDNSRHSIRGIMYSMYRVAGWAGTLNYTPSAMADVVGRFVMQ